MPDVDQADQAANGRPDLAETWVAGVDAYRDYLSECLAARSMEDWLDAYGRLLSRGLTLAGDYAEALGSNAPK